MAELSISEKIPAGEIPLNKEEDTPNKKEVHDAMYSSVRFKYKSTTVQGVVSPEFYYEY